MKRRRVHVGATDRAVLDYLREHGIDVEAVRRHVAGLALKGAELRAVAVKIERVRLELRERGIAQGKKAKGTPRVLVVAVNHRRGDRADG